MEELLNSNEAKQFLRTAIVYSIRHHQEFYYLEELANVNHRKFNEGLVNLCLDRYIQLRKEGETQFKSKYAAMYGTSLRIMGIESF